MHDRIAKIIYIYNMFRPGRCVGVGVSGGADSVALLHILLNLAPELQVSLHVLHVNHHLRGEESDTDAQFVAELAGRFHLPCSIHDVDVRKMAESSGDNLEQAARRARYDYFHSLIRSGSVDRVAVGHTRSDQAETVLFRFLRGSGTAGLSAIRPVNADGIVRPLLTVSRSEIESYLRLRGIEWRDDSSNRDPQFARNRIRHSLIPQLTAQWNPALEETLARMASVAQEEEQYWEEEISHLAAGCMERRPPAVILTLQKVEGLPRAVQRRLLRAAVTEAKGDLRGIGVRHIEDLLDLTASTAGDGAAELPGIRATRSFGWLRLVPANLDDNPPDYLLPVPVPGQVMIPGGNSIVRIESVGEHGGYSADKLNNGGIVDPQRFSGSLQLRNPKPGDKFQRSGHRSEVKLKELFQKAQIPSWDRSRWPIIIDGGGVVWARQFGVAAGYQPGPGSKELLRIKEISDDSGR